MNRILIVEDEPDISELIESYLRNDGYQVSVAHDGIEAIDLFSEGSYDLVVLDIMIPGIDGYGVCEYIRKHSSVPVMFLSALDDDASVIKGYDRMADDYMTKPFSIGIFLRKVKALLRRGNISSEADGKLYRYRDIVMDPDRMLCSVGNKPVELTAREYELLLLLIKNPGRVYSRGMLLDMLWDYNSLVDERIVDSHIKNIRQKLGGDYIDTVRGRGYRVIQKD
ncbi:MAG: response regulator transcription factor [Clostridiales bacterium]|nr:response regulator transcription factor [Clostridiales bacterium]